MLNCLRHPLNKETADQSLQDAAALASAEEGIRQGLEDARVGRHRDAREFFAEFEARNGIKPR